MRIAIVFDNNFTKYSKEMSADELLELISMPDASIEQVKHNFGYFVFGRTFMLPTESGERCFINTDHVLMAWLES